MVDSQLNFVSVLVSAPITLADIEIRDIGAEGGSASAANAVRVVLQELVASILNSNDLPGLDGLRESVEGRIQDGAQRVEEAVEDLGGRLRNILNQSSSQLRRRRDANRRSVAAQLFALPGNSRSVLPLTL